MEEKASERKRVKSSFLEHDHYIEQCYRKKEEEKKEEDLLHSSSNVFMQTNVEQKISVKTEGQKAQQHISKLDCKHSEEDLRLIVKSFRLSFEVRIYGIGCTRREVSGPIGESLFRLHRTAVCVCAS